MSSQYGAESESAATIAGGASDVCGAGGGAERGFEMTYLSPKVLILNMDMHENLCWLTTPNIFLLLGASADELLSMMLTTGAGAVACEQGWVQAPRMGPPPPFVFHRTAIKLFV